MSTTMGMGIGTNTERPNHGFLTGTQIPIACSVWFTSTGRILPQLIKYQDESHVFHTISHFRILAQSDKYYCGIPMIEYECETQEDEKRIGFHLLFYIEQKEWKLWWKYISP